MRPWWLLVVAFTAPTVLAHGGSHRLDEQLVDDGSQLMLGAFKAPQPGPLVVLPFDDGPLACDGSSAGFRATLDLGTTLQLALNTTKLVATFSNPTAVQGFASFAVDTNAASRSLILMQEHATSLHRLGALVVDETGTQVRSGVMGVPYALPVDSPHDFEHGNTGGGIQLDYESMDGVTACGNSTSVVFDRSRLRSLDAGSVVHAVVLYDPTLPYFLPRPIEESTVIVQLNLYLTRPGEDPAEVVRALDGKAGPSEWVPLGVLGVGVAAIAAPNWIRRGRDPR